MGLAQGPIRGRPHDLPISSPTENETGNNGHDETATLISIQTISLGTPVQLYQQGSCHLCVCKLWRQE